MEEEEEDESLCELRVVKIECDQMERDGEKITSGEW